MQGGPRSFVGNAVSYEIPSAFGHLLSPLSGGKQNMGLFWSKGMGVLEPWCGLKSRLYETLRLLGT